MKNGSMRTGRFTAMLAALACGSWGVWGTAGACAQPLPEPVPVVSAHCATGDIDGDGELDLAFGSSADDFVTMAYGFGNFNFVVDNDNPIMVGVSPEVLSAIDRCDGQLPDLIVSNDTQTTIMFVQSPTLNPVVTLVTPTFEFPNCPDGMSEDPCNDSTEPDCEPNSQGEGIQECMRAARCRFDKCTWTASIEYADCGWFKHHLLAYQTMACAAVFVINNAICLPTDLVREWVP